MTAIRQVSSSAQESGISFKEYGKLTYTVGVVLIYHCMYVLSMVVCRVV